MRFSIPCALFACALVAGNSAAQIASLSNVSFTNRTGGPRDGLTLTFNQPLNANQPILVPGGGNIVPPFTTPPTYPSPETVAFSGATVAEGERVPPANASMRFVAPSNAGLDVVTASWTQGGASTNTVARVVFYNNTGVPADTIDFEVLDASGGPMTVIDVSLPNDFQPSSCLTSVMGMGTLNRLATSCCISGVGSPVGPIQLTFNNAQPFGQVLYTLSASGAKVGSSADRVVINSDAADGGPLLRDALACAIDANMVIDDIYPRTPNPLPNVLGFGFDFLYLSGGLVPPELGLASAHIIITSTDTGPNNIRFDDVIWFREAFGNLPELVYYTFDETSQAPNLTRNRASTPVASLMAPVNGHFLGIRPGQFDRALTGGGEFSDQYFVDTGYAPNLPGGFTVAFWIRRGGAAIPGSSPWYVFGDPTAQFECSVVGNDVTLQVGADTLTIPNGFPDVAAAHLLWSYDPSNPSAGFIAYRNGIGVAIGPVTHGAITGSGPLKVGGSGSALALLEGAILDEFRLYSNPLGAPEVQESYNSSLGAETSMAQWQVNSSEARLEINATQGTAFAPADVNVCIGSNNTFTLDSSNVGFGWDLLLTGSVNPMQPRVVIQVTTTDDPAQIVNLDLSQPFFALNGLSFANAFSPIVNLPVNPGAVDERYVQGVVLSPTMASGLALSAPAGFHVTDAGNHATIQGPLEDDGTLMIVPGGSQLCGPSTIMFGGSSYSEIFVNSNGSITFGQGDLEHLPTLQSFVGGPPRLSGFWTDFDASPATGAGNITTQVIDHVLVVTYTDVPDALVPGTRNSVQHIFNPDGSVSISGFVGDPLLTSNTFVGLRPSGAVTPVEVVWSTFVGAGTQFGSASDAIFQSTDGFPPSGFYSITFPMGDARSFVVE